MKPFVSEDRNVLIDFRSGLVTIREREEILEARLTKKDLENLYYAIVASSLLQDCTSLLLQDCTV